MTLWIYKQTHDNNFAPHVSREILSLACCKPNIRKRARHGDWVMSVAGKTNTFGAEYGQLVSLFEVQELLDFAEYASSPMYTSRDDNLFEVNRYSGELVAKPNLLHHATIDAQETDLSGLKVLVSRRFRYFPGATGPHLARIGAAEFITQLRDYDRRPITTAFNALVAQLFADEPRAPLQSQGPIAPLPKRRGHRDTECT